MDLFFERFLVERFLVDRFLVDRFLVDRFLVDRFLVDRFLVDRFLVDRFLVLVDRFLVDRFLVLVECLYPFPIWVVGELSEDSDFDFVCKAIGEGGGVNSERLTDFVIDNGFLSSIDAIDDISLSLNEIGLISGNLRNPNTFNILGHSSIVSVVLLVLLLIVTVYLEINFE